VVAHSAPWRHSNLDEQSYLNEVISNLLEAAE
jgi:uroporphyrin-III C-methyltransferase/precorrin-2 dehydrogenase/sirohydrochlorin ferrochelatase